MNLTTRTTQIKENEDAPENGAISFGYASQIAK